MPALFRFAQLLALLTVVFVLSACGGGGSSDKEAATHAVSATSGAGGTISPASRNVAHGATATFEVTPQSGYSIDVVSGCNGTLDGGTYTTGAITGACTVGATFAINRYTVNSIAGTGGSISPATQLVNHGATAGFTVTPESGYDIDTVTGCNGTLVGNTYRTGAITGACTVSATFAVKTETTKFTVEGQVLNGVLVGSMVDVFGANGGSVLGTATTDADGRYAAEVSRDGPYRLRASGGKLGGVDYTGILESACPAGSGCFVTPYTTVILRLVDDHGFNYGDAKALMANSLGFDGDPFAEEVPAEDFDLGVARHAIAGGDGLDAWVAGVAAWATEDDAEPPPGIREPEPVEPPPPADPGPTLSLEQCDFLGCRAVSLPFSGVKTASLTVLPAPEWYALGEYRLRAGPSDLVIRNVRAVVISGTAREARFTGLEAGTLASGGELSFQLQSTRSPDASTLEFAFDIEGIAGSPFTFFARVTVTTPGDLDPDPIVPVTHPVSATAGTGGSITPPSRVVDHGVTATFTVTPQTGYRIDTVSGCDGSLDGITYTTDAITEGCTVSATFALMQYTLTYTASSNGSLSGETVQTVGHGKSGTAVTAVPDTGFSFTQWSDASTANPRTDSNVTGGLSVTASFARNSYTVSATAGTGGSISPTSQPVEHGATAIFTVTPATGYSVDSVSGCNGTLDGSTYITGAVTGACTVSATFALNQYTVDAVVGTGGRLDPTSRTVTHGATATFEVITDTGYSIDEVTGCGGSLARDQYIIGAVAGSCTVTASFTLKTYTVSTSAGTGGSISPSSRDVVHGSTATFEVTSETGYGIDTVTGCNGTLVGSNYKTGAITGPCTVSASFVVTLQPPANVQAEPGDGAVILSWAPAPGAQSYNVYWSTTPGIHPYTAASYDGFQAGVESPSTVSGLANWQEHYFVVTSVTGSAESLASAEIAATPSPPMESGAVVTGSFSGSRTFGTGENEVTLTAEGMSDMFLARYRDDGSLAWAVRAGGSTLNTVGREVAVDSTGHILVTGIFGETVTFGSGADATTLTSMAVSDIFIARYRPDGTLDWVGQGSSSSNVIAESIAVDAHGDVVVTGSFWGNVIFGSGSSEVSLVAPEAGLFLARYRRDGTLDWAVTGAVSGNYIGAGDVTIDTVGNILVTGSFSSTITLGGGLHTRTLTALSNDGFLACFLLEGTLDYAVSFQAGANNDWYETASGQVVAADHAGNVVVAGNCVGLVTFGSGWDTTTISCASDLAYGFVARYLPNGGLDWAVSAGAFEFGFFGAYNLDSTYLTGISVDRFGNTLISGFFYTVFEPFGTLTANAFLARYLPDGTLDWAVHPELKKGETEFESGGASLALATDADGNAFVVGSFVGVLNFGEGVSEVSLTSTPGDYNDLFLASYQPNGALRWAIGIPWEGGWDWGWQYSMVVVAPQTGD